MNAFQTWLQNPIVKSLLVAIVSAAAPIIIAAVDHPTGGLANALTKNPMYGEAWAALAYVLHNLYSAWQTANPTPSNAAAVVAAAPLAPLAQNGK